MLDPEKCLKAVNSSIKALTKSIEAKTDFIITPRFIMIEVYVLKDKIYNSLLAKYERSNFSFAKYHADVKVS